MKKNLWDNDGYISFILVRLLLRSLCFLQQLIFVSVDLDNEDYGKPVAEYFGVSGNGPKVSRFFVMGFKQSHIYKNPES